MYTPHSLLTTALLAITASSQYTTQSPRFGLAIISDNSTINNTLLGACHQGAALQGLCITSATPDNTSPISNYTTFYHNISSSTFPTYNTSITDTPGPLIYKWTAGTTLAVQSSLRLIYSPGSNIAIPIFSPGETNTGTFSFDACGKLYIQRNLDDTVVPPRYLESPAKDRNWFVCWTRYGYLYETLAWRVGGGEAQNPSCRSVEVRRVWV